MFNFPAERPKLPKLFAIAIELRPMKPKICLHSYACHTLNKFEDNIIFSHVNIGNIRIQHAAIVQKYIF
jgi:hypothetical protein